MAPLRLSVARLSAEGSGASLVARLVRLAPGGATTAEQRRVVVPGRGELRLDLTPGRWLLEATLPSGESLSQSFDVAPEAVGVVDVQLGPEGPDLLGWQRLLGAAPLGGARLRAGRQRDRPTVVASSPPPADARELEEKSVASDPDMRVLADPLDEVGSPRAPQPSRGLGAALDPAHVAHDGGKDSILGADEDDDWEPVRSVSSRGRSRPTTQVTSPSVGSGGTLAERLGSRRGAALVPSWHRLEIHEGCEQHIFAALVPRETREPLGLAPVAGAGAPAWSAVLPWPWPGIGDEPPAAVEALVSPTSGAPEVSIAVRDARFGPALGYLAAGDLASAALLIDDVATHVFERLENPLAAAAVGYILLGQWQRAAWESQAARPVWLDWTDALMRQAAWLPDGAILRGWLELRGRAGEPDLRQARVALLTALERGLPYYAAGARRLYDGLTLLRQAEHLGDDRELARAHAEARWLSLRIDPRQAFTVVRLHDA